MDLHCVATIPADETLPPPMLETMDLRRQLWDRLTSADYRPPMLPSTASEILSLTSRADVDINDILRLLERDAMLAARVLRVAQSPFYARSMAIRSLKQAVVSLGLSALRNMVAESVVQSKLFRVNGYSRDLQILFEHCRATAYLSQLVCKRTGVDPEYAFMCGLFHDIGIAAVLQVVEEREVAHGSPTRIEVWPAVNGLHCEAAALLVRYWKLPGGIEQVVRHHHDLRSDPAAQPLTTAIRLADCIAREIQFARQTPGVRDPVDEERATLDEAADVLALSPKDVGRIREESSTVLKQIAA